MFVCHLCLRCLRRPSLLLQHIQNERDKGKAPAPRPAIQYLIKLYKDSYGISNLYRLSIWFNLYKNMKTKTQKCLQRWTWNNLPRSPSLTRRTRPRTRVVAHQRRISRRETAQTPLSLRPSATLEMWKTKKRHTKLPQMPLKLPNKKVPIAFNDVKASVTVLWCTMSYYDIAKQSIEIAQSHEVTINGSGLCLCSCMKRQEKNMPRCCSLTFLTSSLFSSTSFLNTFRVSGLFEQMNTYGYNIVFNIS